LRILRILVALFLLTTAVAPAASAGALDGAPIEPLVLEQAGVTGAFVHARPGQLNTSITAARAAGLTVGQPYEKIGVAHVIGTAAAFKALSLSPSIEWIEANRPIHMLMDSSHKATRGEEAYRGTDEVPGYDGSGVGVAVIDTGVDGTIPALQPALERGANLKILCPVPGAAWRLATQGFMGCPTDTVTVDMEDTDTIAMGGHGTHVAGIVAAAETEVVPSDTSQRPFTVHGAAPGAALYGIGAGAALSVDNAMDGLEWVLDNHDSVPVPIKVINNSWGTAYEDYRDPDDPANPGVFIEDGYRLHRALWKMQEQLVEEGITVVMAAGNSGGGLGPAPTTVAGCVNPTPGVICVANYNDFGTGSRSGVIDGSSSRGQRDRPETWPDIAAPGTNIVSTCRPSLPVCATGAQINDEYFALSGTSMAAPHIAGIVAQLLEADPTLTPADIEDVLEDTAHKFEWGTPYGRYTDETNADDESSFEKGHGLVDVLAAVQNVESPPVGPAGPDPIVFAASGLILGQGATSFFEPTVESNSSITMHAFENTCDPTVPPTDGYVFEIPPDLADGKNLIAASGGNAFGLWDFNMWLYDEACNRVGSHMGGIFGDVSGRLLENTRYVVVTNHFFGLTTAGITIQPPPIVFTPESVFSGPSSDAAPIGVRVSALDESPRPDATVRFELIGSETQTWEGTTDNRGIARSLQPLNVPAGEYTLRVSYVGDDPSLGGAVIERAFTVVAEDTAMTLSASGSGSKRTVAATLGDDDGDPVVGRTITFYASGAAIGTAVTDSSGVARVAVPSRYRSPSQVFESSFCGDGFYLSASVGQLRCSLS